MLVTSERLAVGPYKVVQGSPTNDYNFANLEGLLQRAFGDQVGFFWPRYTI